MTETPRQPSDDAAREAFLAAIGHEMRTPLGAMLGLTELALSSDSPAEIRDCLLRVQRNGMALLSLVNDLLDVSKIEHGEFDLDERTYDIQALVDDVLDALAARAAQKNLELRAHVDAEVPAWLRGDPNRLRQVLMNLMGNAVKFTPRGAVTLYVAVAGERLELRVVDTGIGMDADDAARAFDKFWRSAKVRGYGGTGLGLAITQAIVVRMGGAVRLTSQPGVGSTFVVRLPLQPEQLVGEGRRPQVMLTVRDATLRKDMLRTLLRRGYPLAVFESALDAVHQRALMAVTPGILVADADDPDLTELAAEVRQARGAVLAVMPLDHRGAGVGYGATLNPPWRMGTLCERLDALAMERAARLSTYLPTRAERARAPGLRLLVVDDTADSARVTSHVLRKAGYEVDVADDGARAIERLQNREYALVVMDVEMPEVDGIAATRRIRADERAHGWPRTPVLGLSAHGTDSVRNACLAAGMDDFCAKPIDKLRLLDWTAQWLERRPHVLVVDDCDDVRVALRRFLEADGAFRASQAPDGASALRSLARGGVALLVLDREMPDLDGLEVLARLRAGETAAQTPVLMLSGHDDPAFDARCVALGAARRLLKPVSRRDFLEAVRGLIDPPVVEDPDADA